MSKRNRYATQGRVMIEALKRRPMTYRQMIEHGPGLSPWKRVKESLADGESVIVTEGADGLVRWRVTVAQPKAIWPAFTPPKKAA